MYKINKAISVTIFILLINTALFPCTIGIIRADLSDSGRPMIWKTRDSGFTINYPVYNDSGIYAFTGLIHNFDLDKTWAGVNNQGFAILNSLSNDLPGSSATQNGNLMTYALSNFANIYEFEAYLDETNQKGRYTKGNFAVVDAFGNAAMYEIANNVWFKFDVNDELQAPEGYIVRTNFSYTGQSSYGIERYNRSNTIIRGMVGNNFTVQQLAVMHFRDFSDAESNPYDIPFYNYSLGSFGYININRSICNNTSTAAIVIEGINSFDQVPVMWTATGFPATTPLLPYIPEYFSMSMNNIPLLSQEIRHLLMDKNQYPTLLNTLYFYKPNQNGIWDLINSFETTKINDFSDFLERENYNLNFSQWIANANTEMYYLMSNIKSLLTTEVQDDTLTPSPKQIKVIAYPNPNNGNFKLSLNYDFKSDYTVEVYNVKGQLIEKENYNKSKLLSDNNFQLSNNLSSGVYIVKIKDNQNIFTTRLLKLN